MSSSDNNNPFADLVCIDCRTTLDSQEDDSLSCPECGKAYPISGGVPRFSPEDSFYEGKVVHTNRWREPDGLGSRFWARLERALNITKIRERFFFEAFGERGDILDVGCGGGTEILTRFGTVTGIDLSGRSCERAAKTYSRAVQSDVAHTPFPDNSFDYVVGSDVFGHIPVEGKGIAIAEFRRVLKPGGLLLLVIECLGDSFLWKFARGRSDLWHKHFVLQDGHFGLESAEVTLSRFQEAGLRRVVMNRSHSDFWSIEDYLARFKNQYRKGTLPLRMWVHGCKLVHKVRFAEHVADLVLGTAARLTDPLRDLNATGALLVSFINDK